MTVILGTIEQGLIYAIMALGVYITYKILDFPDLTVDGSFPLGGAVTAPLLVAGLHPLLTLPVAFAAGAVAGTITGFIHVKLRVQNLIAGIIVATGLYTINLRIAKTSNIPFRGFQTLFRNPFLSESVPSALAPYMSLILIVVVSLASKFILDWYLGTKSGYLLRAVGDNDLLVTTLAKNKGSVKIIGLAIANGLTALAGAVMVQWQGYFDISMGVGTVVIGLASVVVGLALSKRLSWLKVTTAVVSGAILYRACIALALQVGTINLGLFTISITANDLKLLTAILLLVTLVMSWERTKKVRSNGAKPDEVKFDA